MAYWLAAVPIPPTSIPFARLLVCEHQTIFQTRFGPLHRWQITYHSLVMPKVQVLQFITDILQGTDFTISRILGIERSLTNEEKNLPTQISPFNIQQRQMLDTAKILWLQQMATRQQTDNSGEISFSV